MRILVTGGTGHLGRVVVSRLAAEGHELRVLARRPGVASDVEWITGDLATGEGIRQAVAGVDAIVHAATHSPAAQRGRFRLGDFVRSPADVDVQGTRALVDAGEQEGIERFVHVSIAGLQSMRRLPYARRKLQAEAVVRSSDVPWSIVRATVFYWLLERMCENMVSQPVLALPAHACMAPVDSDEVADEIVDCVVRGRLGERQDYAGPQTLTMVELMEQYLAATGGTRRIHRAPLPRRLQAAITAGNTSAGARRGTTTWAQWLQRSAAAESPDLQVAA